jgi:GT2 family glycosyltransferase
MDFLIVIPHFGSNTYLAKLLPTLGAEAPTDDELETTNPLIAHASNGAVIYIWNNNIRNLGFTKACNEGIRYGQNNGFDVVWLLNNDTEVDDIKETLNALEKEFLENTKTGVVGFKILAMDNPDFIHHGGTGDAFPAGVHKVGHVVNGELNKRTKEKWVTGASMAISAGCILEIGTMDEHFVNYGSDSDYCYRARLAGYDCVYLPIPVRHRIGQSQNPSPEQMKVIKGDMLYFANKWINGKLFADLALENL